MLVNPRPSDRPCPRCDEMLNIAEMWDDPIELGGAFLEVTWECPACDWVPGDIVNPLEQEIPRWKPLRRSPQVPGPMMKQLSERDLVVEVNPVGVVGQPGAVELVVRYPDGSYDRCQGETFVDAWAGLGLKVWDAITGRT